MKIFLFFVLFNYLCKFSYSYSVELFFPQVPDTIHATRDSIEFIEKFYHTTHTLIKTKNNKTFDCLIPISSSQVEEDMLGNVKATELKKEEAEEYLFFLKGECAQIRKPDFIWEFCHNKYIRQFDDESTFKQAQKKIYENYFLGFHRGYDVKGYVLQNVTQGNTKKLLQIKETRKIDEPEPFASHYINQPVMIKNFGKLVKLISDSQSFMKYLFSSQASELKLVIFLPENLFSPEETFQTDPMIGASKKESKKFNNITHISFRYPIAYIVDNFTLVLKEEPKFQFISEHYQIIEDSNITKKLKSSIPDHSIIHVYNQYIISQFPLFMSGCEVGDAFTFVNYNVQKSMIIKKIWNENLIELEDDINIAYPIHPDSTFQLFRNYGVRRRIVYYGTGIISIFGRLIFGNGTEFMSDIQLGDIIAIKDTKSNDFSILLEFVVVKILDDTLLIIENNIILDVSLVDATYYIMKSQEKTEKTISQSDDYQVKNGLSKPDLEPLRIWDIPNYIILHRSLGVMQNDAFRLPAKGEGLIRFKLQNIKLSELDDAIFQMFLENEDGILFEIILWRDKKLYIKTHEENSVFKYGSIFAEDDLKEEFFWILVFRSQILFGKTRNIKLTNILVAFPHKNADLITKFSFDTSFNKNYVLSQLSSQPIFEDLSITAGFFGTVPISNVSLEYEIEYNTSGSYCDAVKKNRKANIKYVCSSTGQLLNFEHIEEPETCVYNIKIGSRLFCSQEEKPLNHYDDKVVCEEQIALN